MTVRRSERPPPGKPLTKSTPSKSLRRTSSMPADGHPKQKSLSQTWPLFGQQPPSFPADPQETVHELEPPSSVLAALAAGKNLPEDQRAHARNRRAPQGLPANAPEWMRAARALADWLEARVERGSLSIADQATVARTWAAFCLGGSTDAQILRVAHLVQRAHSAIRVTPRGQHDLQAAFHAAAGVLHAALPTGVRDRMPLERAVHVVRKLRDEADPWAAIVEGTSELLGWKDHARTHAAGLIRALLEQQRKP
jgi:hypothetical protein